MRRWPWPRSLPSAQHWRRGQHDRPARRERDARQRASRSRRRRRPRSRQGKHTAALAWHTSSDYTTAVDQGAKDEFARLGIEVVAETDAGSMPPSRRATSRRCWPRSRASSCRCRSIPIPRPRSTGRRSRPASCSASSTTRRRASSRARTTSTIVSDDLVQMGEKAADAMAAAIGGKGKVGYLFHDANFYVTNQRDQAFKETIQAKYPGHRDRRRAGPRRSDRGRGHHQRLHDQESRSRRRST